MSAYLIPPDVLYQGEVFFAVLGLVFGLGLSLRIDRIRAAVGRFRR